MKQIIAALALLIVCACDRPVSLKKTFLPEYDSLTARYFAGSVDQAEGAMLDQLQLIERAETEKMEGLEFDKLRFVAYLRLARVRYISGKKEEADQDMARAVAFHRASYSYGNGKSDTALSAELTKLAEGIEKENPPKWKKQ